MLPSLMPAIQIVLLILGQGERISGGTFNVGQGRMGGCGALVGLLHCPVDQCFRIVGRRCFGLCFCISFVIVQCDGVDVTGVVAVHHQFEERTQIVDGVVPFLIAHVQNVAVGELGYRLEQRGGVHGRQIHLAFVGDGLPGVLVHVVAVTTAQPGQALAEGLVFVANDHRDVLVLVPAVPG